MAEDAPNIEPEDREYKSQHYREIMSGCPSETQEILEDQEAFMALSTKVILDLLENEPNTYTIDDVKVRFR
jgi:hypothetical protein